MSVRSASRASRSGTGSASSTTATDTLRESIVSDGAGSLDASRARGSRARDLGAQGRLVRRATTARPSASSAGTAPASRRCSRFSPVSRRRRRGAPRYAGASGSLLEVGTGFHPELTGRENVYLNGVDPRHEARARSNASSTTSSSSPGVEQFIDTPVKRYSSGMYVRLAFAVAAHLEPEILLIDEVLAVGDAEFQKRCLGRMEDFGSTGRTVIFVSHSMQAIAQFCERAIWIDGGRVAGDGPSARVVAEYLQAGHGSSSSRSGPISRRRLATSSCDFGMRVSSKTTPRLRPSMSDAPSASRSASWSCPGMDRRCSPRSKSSISVVT